MMRRPLPSRLIALWLAIAAVAWLGGWPSEARAQTPWTTPACDMPPAAAGNSSPLADSQAPTLADGSSSDISLQLNEQSAALGGDTFAVTDGVGGYLDNAVLGNRVRFRYDHLKGNNFADRAEYLYAAGLANGGPAGVPLGNLRYQEFKTYVEWQFHKQVSVFGEFPIRIIDNAIGQLDLITQQLDNTQNAGAGDVTAGIRYALLQQCGSYVTAQLKVYVPTGDASNYLGTGHASIEAGVLFQHQWDRLTVFGQLLDWQATSGTRFDGLRQDPLAGDLFSGNVLNYGLGLGLDLGRRVDHCTVSRLTLVFEVVGWSVLDGLRSGNGAGFQPVEDATGDTIVNGKYGLRYTLGHNTVYVGYGTAWTEDRWYSDLLRVELGHRF
ncbi:MAG: hypothetical protein J5I93_22385 [Pirellulaceae bacterium]|nr:hypothetical protein [Pirellulaceae bacterium]